MHRKSAPFAPKQASLGEGERIVKPREHAALVTERSAQGSGREGRFSVAVPEDSRIEEDSLLFFVSLAGWARDLGASDFALAIYNSNQMPGDPLRDPREA